MPLRKLNLAGHASSRSKHCTVAPHSAVLVARLHPSAPALQSQRCSLRRATQPSASPSATAQTAFVTHAGCSRAHLSAVPSASTLLPTTRSPSHCAQHFSVACSSSPLHALARRQTLLAAPPTAVSAPHNPNGSATEESTAPGTSAAAAAPLRWREWQPTLRYRQWRPLRCVSRKSQAALPRATLFAFHLLISSLSAGASASVRRDLPARQIFSVASSSYPAHLLTTHLRSLQTDKRPIQKCSPVNGAM